jgi:hypothetical protein
LNSEVVAASSFGNSSGQVIMAADWSSRSSGEATTDAGDSLSDKPDLRFDAVGTGLNTERSGSRSMITHAQAEKAFNQSEGIAVPPMGSTPAFPAKEPELLPIDPPKSDSDFEKSPSDFGIPRPGMRPEEGSRLPIVPPRPQGSRRNEANCDEVRDRAASSNISSIDLDVAPSFPVGPKDKLTSDEKRRNFAKSAASRKWSDHDGNLLLEGKLIGYENHTIIVEALDGEKFSISIRDISDADAIYVYEAWGLPATCSLGNQAVGPRTFEGSSVTWKASGLCHKPLYFEEIQLERSGHEYGPIVQPALSTVHFFKNIAFLPYKMGIHPMTECQYALGHYRPGNCAPWSIEPVPLSLRGFAAQAKVVTGAVLAFP